MAELDRAATLAALTSKPPNRFVWASYTAATHVLVRPFFEGCELDKVLAQTYWPYEKLIHSERSPENIEAVHERYAKLRPWHYKIRRAMLVTGIASLETMDTLLNDIGAPPLVTWADSPGIFIAIGPFNDIEAWGRSNPLPHLEHDGLAHAFLRLFNPVRKPRDWAIREKRVASMRTRQLELHAYEGLRRELARIYGTER